MYEQLFIAVINLDRRPDRMGYAERQLKLAGITHWNRIPAIDGAIENVQTRIGVSNHQGACWLSHQRTYRSFLNSDQEFALVLEDDFMLTGGREELAKLIDISISVMQENTLSILQLGFHPRRETLFSRIAKLRASRYFAFRRRLFIKHEFLNGTFAYLLSRDGAKDLLGLNVPVARAADEFLEDLARQSRISGWGVWRITRSSFKHATGGDSGIALDSDVDGISDWD
jgi:GR25 family glycosyltransferase involved in LPS biosynthesis